MVRGEAEGQEGVWVAGEVAGGASWQACWQRWARASCASAAHLPHLADGGAVIQQRHYHNFKQFRIFDLSDHKMAAQHLIVSKGAGCVAGGGAGSLVGGLAVR